jgi:hypothetical protein
MELIILDNKENIKEKLIGTYESGIFTYKYGGFLGFFQKTKRIETFIPYEFCYQLNSKKGKTAYLKFNGKDYIPLSLKELNNKNQDENTISIRDYTNAFTISELTKEQMLTKPRSLQQVMEILILILIGVMIIALWWITTSATSSISNYGVAINKSLSNQNAEINYLKNATNQNYLEFQKLMIFLNSYNNSIQPIK